MYKINFNRIKSLTMRSYIFLPLLMSIFNLSPQKSALESTIIFPKKFEYTSYATSGWKVYVKSGSDFTEIAPAGTFATFNQDANEMVENFMDFLPFNEITLQSEDKASLANSVSGHDYFGIHLNANYTNQSGDLTFTVSSADQSANIWGVLSGDQESMSQFVSCTKYSYHKQNSTTGYSPFDFNPSRLVDYNNSISNIQNLHNLQTGDTLAVMFLTGKFVSQ